MKIENIIKSAWEFPQNLLGLIVKKIIKAEPIFTYKDATVYFWKAPGGMSLGKYIFVPFKKINPKSNAIMRFVKHEYGHTLQSKKLGWLYLIVIGLPSLIWAQCFQKYRDKTGTSYYAFYTEKWANQLGEVERNGE